VWSDARAVVGTSSLSTVYKGELSLDE